MSVDVITSIEDLRAIEPEWTELWRGDLSATPFQSPQWILPWYGHFGAGDLLALAQRRNGRLEALAPLFIVRDEDDPSQSLGMLLGTGNTDYLDILSYPGCGTEDIVAQMAAADCAMWDLQQLRSVSPLLAAPAPDHFQDLVEQQEPCLVLSIAAAGPELQNVSSAHFRKKLRYYRRLLEREGAVSVETPTPATLDTFLDTLFELHAARWKARGLPGMLAAEVDQSFHRQVAPGMLAAGVLRMYLLRAGRRPVAVFYGFAHHHTVFYYLSGYDPSYDKSSPGTLIVAHAMTEAVRDGATTFDFLRGAEDYKYAWGAQDRWNQRRQLIRDSPA